MSENPTEVALDTDEVDETGLQVTEHAILMSGGSMQVRSRDPHIETIYPLTDWIEAQQRHGGKVYTRKVIVVEDWTEVPT